jgi:hypothetical protein
MGFVDDGHTVDVRNTAQRGVCLFSINRSGVDGLGPKNPKWVGGASKDYLVL